MVVLWQIQLPQASRVEAFFYERCTNKNYELNCLSLKSIMATHSSILAWRISWAGEPGRLQSVGSKRSNTTERLPNPYAYVLTPSTLECGYIWRQDF